MIYKNFNVFCIVSYTLQCIYCAAYTIITFTKSFIQQFSSAKTSRVTVATLHIAHTSGFRHFTLKHVSRAQIAQQDCLYFAAARLSQPLRRYS